MSTLRVRHGVYFTPLQTGYVPTLESIPEPDFSRHLAFADSFSQTSMDLVAERFIGRGFAKKIAEHIPFQLGFWASIWNRGRFRLIMPSQWKVPFKKYNSKFTDLEGYENWWEWYFSEKNSSEDRRKKVVHAQDATAIALYYWREVLKVDCQVEGLNL